jgi:hypothetical protein
MTEKEFSTLISDSSSSLNSCLNESFFSHTTNGSGEKEFKEYNIIIKK